MRHLRNILVLSVLASIVFMAGPAVCETTYAIDPEESSLTGSVRYALVGHYEAWFNDFSGHIVYDESTGDVHYVELSIDTASIESEHSHLDETVRSPKLLDAEKYPTMDFESDTVIRTERGYEVDGDLTAHGVTRRRSFPFQMDLKEGEDGRFLEARGRWVIPRKDFGIIWHPYLDVGGIIVSNYIILEWKVVAKPER